MLYLRLDQFASYNYNNYSKIENVSKFDSLKR